MSIYHARQSVKIIFSTGGIQIGQRNSRVFPSLMPVCAADVAEAFLASRFLLATAADGLVLAHVVVEPGKRMEAAATVGAVELELVIVAEHRKCAE